MFPGRTSIELAKTNLIGQKCQMAAHRSKKNFFSESRLSVLQWSYLKIKVHRMTFYKYIVKTNLIKFNYLPPISRII